MHSVLGVQLFRLHAKSAHAVEERAQYVRVYQTSKVFTVVARPELVPVSDDNDVFVRVHHCDHLFRLYQRGCFINDDRVK